MEKNRELFEVEARLCMALSNPKRLEILYALNGGGMPAGELARLTGVSMPNLSQHLSILKQFGLVESRKEGLNVFYRIGSEHVMEVCQMLRRQVAEQLARQSELLTLAAAADQDPGYARRGQ